MNLQCKGVLVSIHVLQGLLIFQKTASTSSHIRAGSYWRNHRVISEHQDILVFFKGKEIKGAWILSEISVNWTAVRDYFLSDYENGLDDPLPFEIGAKKRPVQKTITDLFKSAPTGRPNWFFLYCCIPQPIKNLRGRQNLQGRKFLGLTSWRAMTYRSCECKLNVGGVGITFGNCFEFSYYLCRIQKAKNIFLFEAKTSAKPISVAGQYIIENICESRNFGSC